MRGLRVWIQGIGALLGLVLMGMLVDRGYTVLLTSPRFALQEVVVEGTTAVDPQDLMEAAGVVRGTPLFLVDLDQVVSRLRAHPWVKGVMVRREPPHTLRIRIQERVPVAYVEGRGAYYLVDEAGMVLTRRTQPSLPLPRLRGPGRPALEVGRPLKDSLLLQALRIRAELAQTPQLQGMQTWTLEVDSRGEAVLWLGDTRILLGQQAYVARLRRFFQVAPKILDPQRPVREVDLRFANQVVVRP